MNQLPTMVNVADIQRRYRAVADKARSGNEPVVVLNNGEPDVILMGPKQYDAHVRRMNIMEEEYLLAIGGQALDEYRDGESVLAFDDESLEDVIKRS